MKKINEKKVLKAQLADKIQELAALRNDHNRLYDNWREVQNLLKYDSPLGLNNEVNVKARILSLLDFKRQYEGALLPEREHNRDLMRVISWIVSPPIAAADEEKEKMREEIKRYRGF